LSNQENFVNFGKFVKLGKINLQAAPDNKYSTRTDFRLFVIKGYLLLDSKFEDFIVFEADFAVCVIGRIYIRELSVFQMLVNL
jgi:hypothetical protein